MHVEWNHHPKSTRSDVDLKRSFRWSQGRAGGNKEPQGICNVIENESACEVSTENEWSESKPNLNYLYIIISSIHYVAELGLLVNVLFFKCRNDNEEIK